MCKWLRKGTNFSFSEDKDKNLAHHMVEGLIIVDYCAGNAYYGSVLQPQRERTCAVRVSFSSHTKVRAPGGNFRIRTAVIVSLGNATQEFATTFTPGPKGAPGKTQRAVHRRVYEGRNYKICRSGHDRGAGDCWQKHSCLGAMSRVAELHAGFLLGCSAAQPTLPFADRQHRAGSDHQQPTPVWVPRFLPASFQLGTTSRNAKPGFASAGGGGEGATADDKFWRHIGICLVHHSAACGRCFFHHVYVSAERVDHGHPWRRLCLRDSKLVCDRPGPWKR